MSCLAFSCKPKTNFSFCRAGTSAWNRSTAVRIRSEVEALNAVQSEGNRDEQKVADLSGRVQWDTRVFEDRRRALTYVCEAPVLIEQRLGALARTIAAAMG